MKISVFYDLVIVIIILQLSLTKFGVILVATMEKEKISKAMRLGSKASVCGCVYLYYTMV